MAHAIFFDERDPSGSKRDTIQFEGTVPGFGLRGGALAEVVPQEQSHDCDVLALGRWEDDGGAVGGRVPDRSRFAPTALSEDTD